MGFSVDGSAVLGVGRASLLHSETALLGDSLEEVLQLLQAQTWAAARSPLRVTSLSAHSLLLAVAQLVRFCKACSFSFPSVAGGIFSQVHPSVNSPRRR